MQRIGLPAVIGQLLAGVILGRAFLVRSGRRANRGSFRPIRPTGRCSTLSRNDLLNERYDLSNRPAPGVTMERGKPLQEGVRVKLPAGMTWEKLAAMSPEEIREHDLYPKGFYRLPHPNHAEGGFVFPHFLIDAINRTGET